VVVLDNAPYHSVQVDKAPTKYSVKSEMISWLQRHGVACDSTMRKGPLYELIVTKKPREKIFKIDQLLNAHGHTVLRLPPYNCDLSPIELAWAKVKRYVRDRNTQGDLSLRRLRELTTEGIQSVTAEDWEGYCRHVQKLEDEYWERDGIVADVIDEFIINVQDNSSDDESSSDSSSSMESDLELAQPL